MEFINIFIEVLADRSASENASSIFSTSFDILTVSPYLKVESFLIYWYQNKLDLCAYFPKKYLKPQGIILMLEIQDCVCIGMCSKDVELTLGALQ